MALDADVVIDRMVLKRKLRKWQLVALLAIVSIFGLFVWENSSNEMTKAPKNEDYIARIDISGMIVDNTYRDKIMNELTEDKNLRGVLLLIDSPGGTTAAGETIYQQVRAISLAGKPVVVVQRGMAASAAYMISAAGDRIFARNGTITGSIGVLMQSAEFTELAKKVGVEMITIKSTELKASPSPFEKATPEAKAAIQGLINDYYEYFITLVAERRGYDRETVLSIADGRVYTGSQALKLKLIDEIGGEKEALNWLKKEKKLAKDIAVEDVSMVEPPETLAEMLFGKPKDLDLFKKFNMTGLLAVWNPNITE